MKNTAIMSTVNNAFYKVGFKVKKYSPEILIVAGVIGTVTSAVMACKATTKLSDILEDTKEQVDLIHDGMKDGAVNGHEYSVEDGKKDLTIVYAQTAVKVTKLYAPAVILGTLSITSILASNNILRKRNVALAAAYATVDKSFKEYRNHVIDRFGEAVDRELKYNIKAREVEETVVDEKTGEEKTEKKTVSTTDDNLCSPYARFFDESCPDYQRNAEFNLMFLRAQQRYANDLLRSHGHLFLNEVYDMLGMQRTKAGQIVGWRYDPENEKIDNYVDFGIYNINREKNRDFVNGYEPSILLDFNVDGDILSSM